MKITGAGYDPSAWLKNYKTSDKNKTEETPSSKPSISTDTYTPSSKATASDFSTTTDYHSYLKSAYPSIENSNIQISDTVLQQAMEDPEKEKILTQFLSEMDGAGDYMAQQISGMSDDTYTYEMDSFTITLDNIPDDYSGVEGTKFTELTVARNDGKGIKPKEFKEVKNSVEDMFEAMEAQREEQAKQAEKNLQKRLEVKRAEAKEKAEEAQEEERAEKLEQQKEAKVQQEEEKKAPKREFFA